MTTARRYAISAVVVQRMAHVNDVEVEMKMEQDVFGRTRFVIWQPSHMRGLISLDDGVNWYTYMPKHKRVIKQESPRIAQGNPAYQIYLADENYTWKLEKGPDVASCPTVIVTATPKAKGMLTRRYYLDSRTSLMLQMETIAPDGKKTVNVETRSVAYLKESPKMPIPGEDDPEVATRIRWLLQSRPLPPAVAQAVNKVDPSLLRRDR
jgi:outer membrane lipoprotein-sorting protein